MNKKLFTALCSWPKSYITDTDLASLIDKSDAARYAMISRALKDKSLIHIRRGLFVIPSIYGKKLVDSFELAQIIYYPSIISYESALQYHRLIPEAVYTVTSITTERSCEFSTPLGVFSYKKVPSKYFLLGAQRIVRESGIFFLATPWRALADIIYTKKKAWHSFSMMCNELRIEHQFSFEGLTELIKKYPNQRTRKVLKQLWETQNEYSNYSR